MSKQIDFLNKPEQFLYIRLKELLSAISVGDSYEIAEAKKMGIMELVRFETIRSKSTHTTNNNTHNAESI